MFFSLLTALLFAGSVTAARQSTRYHGADLANLGRILVAFVVLGTWVYFSGREPITPGWAWLVLSGALGLGLGDIALFHALTRIGPGLSILLMQCLAAPFALLLEYVALGTTLSWSQAGAAAVILGGVALAMGAPAEGDPAQRRLGIILAVLAALGQACGAVSTPLAKAACLAVNHPVPDGISQGFVRLLGGVPIIVGFVLWRARSLSNLSREVRRPYLLWVALGWLILNGITGPSLGIACYQQALLEQPSAVVLSIVALTPILALPMQWAIEGKRPSGRTWLGAGIGVLGVIALRWA